MRPLLCFATLAMCLGPPAAMASVAHKANDVTYTSTATTTADNPADALPERSSAGAATDFVGAAGTQNSIDRPGQTPGASAPLHIEPG